MAHYSEMDFLFSNTNRDYINKILDNDNADNTRNIFNPNKYVVYKENIPSGTTIPTGYNTQRIKNYLSDKVYRNNTKNPSSNIYVQLVNDFSSNNGTPGAGLKIKAADLAYLKELGVYPINRMAILRRFPEGSFLPEDLNEMTLEPISTVIGWIPPDQNFGSIGFNENWGKTNERFDQLMARILKERIGIDIQSFIPIPSFAQGLLYDFYKKIGLTENQLEEGETWKFDNVPIGDPNMLMEGPFRDPSSQNIQSTFTFKLETTYEQKLLGDVDPGSAMLDIIDNLYAMGTSNMKFYWSENSVIMKNAKDALEGKANSLDAWWRFVDSVLKTVWNGLKDLFNEVVSMASEFVSNVTDAITSSGPASSTTAQKGLPKIKDAQGIEYMLTDAGQWYYVDRKLGDKVSDAKQTNLDNIYKSQNKQQEKVAADKAVDKSQIVKNATGFALELAQNAAKSILTSTVAIFRYEIRGTIELMVGGRTSSTPWYLTIGNPYSPWLATNHIIVNSANIETSTEMAFNDQPQWIKVSFDCQLSRSLGKQELMRMFNNTFKRNYSDPAKIEKAAEKESKIETQEQGGDQEIANQNVQSNLTPTQKKQAEMGLPTPASAPATTVKPQNQVVAGLAGNDFQKSSNEQNSKSKGWSKSSLGSNGLPSFGG